MEIKWRQVSAAILLPLIILTLTVKLHNSTINPQKNQKEEIIEFLMSLSLEELLNIEIIHTKKKTAATLSIPKITNTCGTTGTGFSSWTFSLALGSKHGWLKRWPGIMFPRRQGLFFIQDIISIKDKRKKNF